MPMNQHPEWSYGAVLYEMNVRQLTPEGTLRAAAARLEFLRDLGVDAVWLMPIYPIGEKNPVFLLGSYYSIRDYCAVNPELGTMDDFDDFVAEAHRLTPREREVMELLAQGKSLSGVAHELIIAEGTAKAHTRHIYEKLGINTRQELLDLLMTEQ